MSRPNRKMHETGTEQMVHSGTSRLTLRQVGWLGQTGDFYTLDEDPSPTEPGSFAPLLFVAHEDRTERGFMVVRDEDGLWVNDWDGAVHPTLDAAKVELAAALVQEPLYEWYLAEVRRAETGGE